MRFSAALWAYGIAFLIALAIPVAALVMARRKGKKIHLLHFLLGMLCFIIVLVSYYLVLSRYLSAQDGISDYNNTSLYQTVMLTLLSAVFIFLIWLFARLLYIRKQYFSENASFFWGFGSGAAVLIGTFCIAMFTALLVKYFGSTLLSFDTEGARFYFSDNSYIHIFMPVWGHISYAFAGFGVLAACGIFGELMNSIATRRSLPFWGGALLLIGGMAGFCALVNVLVNVHSFAHYIVALMVAAVDIWMLAMLWLTGVIRSKKEDNYDKQFD